MSAVLNDPNEFALGGSHHRSLTLLRALRDRGAKRLFYQLYPEEDTVWTGPPLMGGLVQTGQILHSRHKYLKHIEWLNAGSDFRERCAMMANSVGKTFSLGGYEIACHLTGLYPDWWEGKVCEDVEVALVLKTSNDRKAELINCIKQLHSYDTPCIACLPIVDGNPDFLKWIADETIRR